MSVVLTTVKNPFEPAINDIQVLNYIKNQTLEFYLAGFELQRDDVTFIVSVNGQVVDDHTIVINDEDKIAIVAKTEGMIAAAVASWAAGAVIGGGTFGGLGAFGMFAYMATYAVVYMATMFVIGYGMSTLSGALAPDAPGVSGTSRDTNVEQTYSWGELRQTHAEDTPVPLLFGKNKVAGQIINKFITLSGDKETLNVLLGICDHQIDAITDVKINNQAYTNYHHVTVVTDQLGSNSDTAIPGFNEVVSQIDVGSKLSTGIGVIQATTGTSVEKIKLIIYAPRGFYYTNEDGGLDKRDASFRIHYRVYNATTPNSWILNSTRKLSGKTTEPQRATYTISGLTPERYEVQVTRIDAEETSFKGSDEIYLSAIQEIVEEALSYPGLAKYAVRAMATDQLSGGMPTFTCMADRQTISVFNRALDTPIWDDKRATNPAWICYAMLVHYANIDESRLIWADWAAWASYCDLDINGTDSFIINTVIQSGNFWEKIQEIAKLGRASVIRRGTKYGVFVDKIENTVSHLFTMGNILTETFKIQYLPRKDRANAVEVEYTDVDKDYTRQVVCVYSDNYLSDEIHGQKSTVRVNAACSKDQAVREGVYRINSNKYLSRVVTFEASIDSFACTVGDIFYFQHETVNYEDGIQGARILDAGNDYGVDTPYVQLDQEVAIETGKSYRVMVRLSDDTLVEKIVNNAIGTTDTLTLTTAWVTIPVKYDVFLFGEADTYKKTYRLTHITRSDDFTREITGIEYHSEIYSENDGYVIEVPTWATRVVKAVHLTLNEFLSYAHDGSYRSNISVAWHRAYTQTGANWTVWIEDLSQEQRGDELIANTDLEIDTTGWTTTPSTCVATGTRNTSSPISDTADYQLAVTTADPIGYVDLLVDFDRDHDLYDQQWEISFDYQVNSGTCIIQSGSILDGTLTVMDETLTGSGTFSSIVTGDSDEDDREASGYTLTWDGSNLFNVQIDNFSIKIIPPAIKKFGDIYQTSCVISSDLVIGNSYKIYVVQKDNGPTDTGDNTATITIQGKLAPPDDVTNFVGGWDSIARQVNFTWTDVTNLDIDHYEIRAGGSWETGTIATTSDFSPASLYIAGPTDDNILYHIKAIDTSGIESLTADSDTVVINTSDCPLTVPTGLAWTSASILSSDGTDFVMLKATWTISSSADYWHHYSVLIEDMTTNNLSYYETYVEQYQTVVIPNRSYGVRIRSTDESGNYTDWSAQVVHTSGKDATLPAAPTWLSSNFAIGGFKVIGLSWNENTEDDFSHYLLERSTVSDFASAITDLGEIRATFTSDSYNIPSGIDTYYYRLKAVDTSGNESAAYSTIVNATTVEVGTTDVAADAIIASKIDVTNLAAINANLGAITAGSIESDDYIATTSTTGTGFKIDASNDTFDMAGMKYDPTNGLQITDPNDNASITIGDSTGTSDYCHITDGDIDFYQYLNGDHRSVKSLKKIETGTATNGTTKTLGGYWSNVPKISVSPKQIMTFNYAYREQDQSMQLSADDITELEDGGVGTSEYEFTPVARLVLSDGSATVSPGTALKTCLDTATCTSIEYTLGISGCRIVSAAVEGDGLVSITSPLSFPNFPMRAKIDYNDGTTWHVGTYSAAKTMRMGISQIFNVTTPTATVDITKIRVTVAITTGSYVIGFSRIRLDSYEMTFPSGYVEIEGGTLNYTAISE